MSQKLKCHQNWNWTVKLDFQIYLQGFGSDCLGLFYIMVISNYTVWYKVFSVQNSKYFNIRRIKITLQYKQDRSEPAVTGGVRYAVASK